MTSIFSAKTQVSPEDHEAGPPPPGAPPTWIIDQLDIKGPNVIKDIRPEGFRVVGQPGPMPRNYYEQGAARSCSRRLTGKSR